MKSRQSIFITGINIASGASASVSAEPIVFYIEDGHMGEFMFYMEDGHMGELMFYMEDGHMGKFVFYIEDGHTGEFVFYLGDGHNTWGNLFSV